jgi:hypothetical protein
VGLANEPEGTDSYSGAEDVALRRAQRPSHSDATRYLCAGGELEEEFANQVISELFAQPRRSVAPSYGIDLVSIAKHCLKGRRRRAIRDIALLVLLVPLLVLFPVLTVLAVLLAFLLQAANVQSRLEGRAAGLILAVAAIVAAAWWLSGSSQSNHVTHAIRASVPPQAWLLLTSGAFGRLDLFLLTLLAVLVLAVLIWFGEWLRAQRLVGRQLREDTFEPTAVRVTLPVWMRRRLEEIDRLQYGEMFSFESGNDIPFVGAGLLGRGWSLALVLHRREGEGADGPHDIEAFTPVDLHRHVEERLLSLRKPEAGLAYGLPGLQIADHFYAPGWYRLEGDPPHIAFSEERVTRPQVERLINGPAGTLRHFKCLRAEWQGREMVAITFLHLAMEGRTLYVEVTPSVLSPIRGSLKNVDNWRLPRFEDVTQELGSAVTGVLAHLFGAPRRLVRSYWHPRAERLRYRRLEWRQRTQGFTVDYGARTSIRQLGSIEEPKSYLQLFDPEKYVMSSRRYLQLLDAEKYTKTIEAQVLDAIMEFLKSHGIDTDEFRARRAGILDSRAFIASVQGDIVAWGQRQAP